MDADDQIAINDDAFYKYNVDKQEKIWTQDWQYKDSEAASNKQTKGMCYLLVEIQVLVKCQVVLPWIL